MAVLVMRAVVNYFEVADFIAAARAYNDHREAAGLPRYRFLGASGGGRVNEIVAVAEFESLQAIDDAEATLATGDFGPLLKAMYAHIVPGTVWEHRFEEL